MKTAGTPTEKDSFADICLDTLQKQGNKVTRTRKAVINSIARLGKQISPRDIYNDLKANKQEIDNVTIYRVLELLENLNLIHRVGATGDFLACSHVKCQWTNHVLTRCRICHEVEEMNIPKELVSPLYWFLHETNGFTPRNHILQLEGICKSCQVNNEAPDWTQVENLSGKH